MIKRSFPEVLRELHKLEFDYADGEGIDFEPYGEFLSLEETERWLQAWTGNSNASSSEYLIFGEDGSGGVAAIWLIRDNEDILSQPVVFFGSEGELGVVSQNFSDYLWVLASGHGPLEAVCYLDEGRTPNADFTVFGEKFATTPQRRLSGIIESAKAEFSFLSQASCLCVVS